MKMNFTLLSTVVLFVAAPFLGWTQDQSQGDFPNAGCTDPEACNYSPIVTEDDGSCAYEANPLFFATELYLFEVDCVTLEPTSEDFEDGGYTIEEDGTLLQYGFETEIFAELCGDFGLFYSEFDPSTPFAFLEIIDETIYYFESGFGVCYSLEFVEVFGCTDPDALNYNDPFSKVSGPPANTDDGSCLYFNACGNATQEDGTGGDFYDLYSSSNWEEFYDDGVGSIFFNDGQMNINSPFDAGSLGGTFVEVYTTAQFTGEYTFDWAFFTFEANAENHEFYVFFPADVVTLNDLSGNSQQSGSYTMFLEEGDEFGFGVLSSSSAFQIGAGGISNFRFPTAPCAVGCAIPTADNYNPNADVFDNNTCIWTNPCGDLVDSNGNKSDFTGDYAVENWDFATDGNGELLVNSFPQEFFGEHVVISGSNTGEGLTEGFFTELSIEIPTSGLHFFTWVFDGYDFSEQGTGAYYSVNSDLVALTDEDGFGISSADGIVTQGIGFGGNVALQLEAGDILTLGVFTTIDCCITPQLIVYNFAYPVACEGGCLDADAANYNPDADFDNEFCLYTNECEELLTADARLAGFTNEFAPENWSVLSMGDGIITHTEDEIFIFGSDSDEGGFDILTEVSIVAPFSGTFTFNWLYQTTDGPTFDIAYYLNDVLFILAQEEDEFGFNFGTAAQSGTVTIEVQEGDVIGFGVNATDDCCGWGSLTISQFIYPKTTVCAPGCTDETACNFDPEANFDNESCDFSCYGCTDETAVNYDPEATIDDGSCVEDCEFPDLNIPGVDCIDGEFTLEITVSDLGNTPPYVITNNVDNTELLIEETGTFTYGPFDEDAEVILAVSATTAPDCNFELPAINCTVGVVENAGLSFNLFPNPANESITIQGASDRQVEVLIFDMAGKMVLNTSLMANQSGSQISVSHLANGSYIVQLRANDSIANERLIIRR